MAYARPDLLHHILETTAQTVIQYLNAQIDAGAQAVMILIHGVVHFHTMLILNFRCII